MSKAPGNDSIGDDTMSYFGMDITTDYRGYPCRYAPNTGGGQWSTTIEDVGEIKAPQLKELSIQIDDIIEKLKKKKGPQPAFLVKFTVGWDAAAKDAKNIGGFNFSVDTVTITSIDDRGDAWIKEEDGSRCKSSSLARGSILAVINDTNKDTLKNIVMLIESRDAIGEKVKEFFQSLTLVKGYKP